ncbi:hypothetical protein KQH65_04595 [archaeon]|nr:hypothetical protein [archaeon]
MSDFFFGDEELTEEEVDEIILEAALRIRKYGMEMPAIMALESFKPLMFVGGEMARLTLSPFFPIFGANVDLWGQKLIYVFEEKENVDKLITLLEKMSTGEYEEETSEEAPEEDPVEEKK